MMKIPKKYGYQIRSEDWTDNDFNDFIVDAIRKSKTKKRRRRSRRKRRPAVSRGWISIPEVDGWFVYEQRMLLLVKEFELQDIDLEESRLENQERGQNSLLVAVGE